MKHFLLLRYYSSCLLYTSNEPIARSLIRKIQFDLILSDVRLPEGDGISLPECLRKERKDIPFIITTEYVSVPDVVRTIKSFS